MPRKRKAKAPDKPVPHVHIWRCCEQEFTPEQFKEHMLKEHGYEYGKGTKATRELILALDGEGFYSNSYRWTIPCKGKDVIALQLRSGPTS